jgi:hypothetical protein
MYTVCNAEVDALQFPSLKTVSTLFLPVNLMVELSNKIGIWVHPAMPPIKLGQVL